MLAKEERNTCTPRDIVREWWCYMNCTFAMDSTELLFLRRSSPFISFLLYLSRWSKTLCIELLGWRLQFLHWTFPRSDWWDSVQYGLTGYLYQRRMQGCSHDEFCFFLLHFWAFSSFPQIIDTVLSVNKEKYTVRNAGFSKDNNIYS